MDNNNLCGIIYDMLPDERMGNRSMVKPKVMLDCPLCGKMVDCASDDMCNDLRCEDCPYYYEGRNSQCERSEELESSNRHMFCQCTPSKMRFELARLHQMNLEYQWRIMIYERKW